MWWFAGRNQTPHPADLGRIKEGPLVGPQEIEWLDRMSELLPVPFDDRHL